MYQKQVMNSKSEQHSIGKSIFLHLFPGVTITLMYIAFIPLAKTWGYPSIFAFFLGIIFGGIPPMLGYILYLAKKKNGSFSLKGIFEYNQKSPLWQYLLIAILYIPFCIVVFRVLPKIYSGFLNDKVFFWIPEWFSPEEGKNLPFVTATVLVITGFVANIFGALIEELYFRGILLPKVSWLGKWAPIFTVLLFAVYHLDSIDQFIERILSMLPLIYLVWKKKDIYFAIIPHCVLNAVSIVLFAMSLSVK